MAKVCFKNKSNTHYLEPIDTEQILNFIEMFFVTDNMYVEPYKTEMLVDNKPLIMKINSGAGVSVITKDIYLDKFKDRKLKSTDVRLKLFNGSIIIPEGEIYVSIKYKS